MLLTIVITILSMAFMFLSHPLSLGGILLVQTCLITLLTGKMYLNFWFSYLLFLIMVSGMLILFIYMTSIASNEKFKIPNNYMLMLSLMIMIIIMAMMKTMNLMDPVVQMTTNITYMNSMPETMEIFYLNKSFNLNKFFSLPFYKLIIFLMIYLFITLIATVKITGKSMGPLRQK
uniref:NADH-ubiquinone oxidoreductase chain 6 n=2 Tax=Curculionoidea TaxID=71529 RepID=A0A343A638_9CUCU|nr:NADH dehydrogenase subunit 6 [Scolytinae sp. BMNH 1040265]AOY40277.1 NADH dehydrogenase subunit 6 [Curculionoidea sp. 2 KM-2015]